MYCHDDGSTYKVTEQRGRASNSEWRSNKVPKKQAFKKCDHIANDALITTKFFF